MVRLPDEVPRGVLITDKAKSDTPNNVQIAVHHGQFEEMIAMATLDLEDLKELVSMWIYQVTDRLQFIHISKMALSSVNYF